ncbi:hypothetical protein EIP86_009760 [Pleurotus ostreatoroseus]|nr:hypothetical protein EIP86_009760 [Pleurotus ostreatoroseus]
MSMKESTVQLGQGVSGADRTAKAAIPIQKLRAIGHDSVQSVIQDAPPEAVDIPTRLPSGSDAYPASGQGEDRSSKEDVLSRVPTGSCTQTVQTTRVAAANTSNLPGHDHIVEDSYERPAQDSAGDPLAPMNTPVQRSPPISSNLPRSAGVNHSTASEDTLDPSFKSLADYLIKLWMNAADIDASRTRLMPLEEDAVALDNQKDLDMLSTVDDILLDDELLTVTMRDVITRSQFDPGDTMLFIKNVLAHRLPQKSAEYLLAKEPYVVDLRPLSPRVWTAISRLIRNALPDDPPLDSSDLPPSLSWINKALAILLSRGTDIGDADRDLPAKIAKFNSVKLPNFGPGAFAGTQYPKTMAYVQTFFSPGRFNKLSFITQILHGQTTFDRSFRPQDASVFHSFSKYKRAMETDWAIGEDPIFVEDVLNSVDDLLFLTWTKRRSDAVYHKEAAETLGVVSLWASQAHKARVLFTQKLFLWLEATDWESIKDMLVTSKLASTTLPWLLFSCGPRDLNIENASSFRILLFALISIYDFADRMFVPYVLPYAVYRFILDLCRSSTPALQQRPDEWSTIIQLLYLMNNQYSWRYSVRRLRLYVEDPHQDVLSDPPGQAPDTIVPLDLVPEEMPEFLERAEQVNSEWSRMNGTDSPDRGRVLRELWDDFKEPLCRASHYRGHTSHAIDEIVLRYDLPPRSGRGRLERSRM